MINLRLFEHYIKQEIFKMQKQTNKEIDAKPKTM